MIYNRYTAYDQLPVVMRVCFLLREITIQCNRTRKIIKIKYVASYTARYIASYCILLYIAHLARIIEPTNCVMPRQTPHLAK